MMPFLGMVAFMLQRFRVRPPCFSAGGFWVVLSFLFAASEIAHAQTSASREYEIKAAFLYNFTKFVEWPPEHFASDDSPIILGVLGRDPFDGELANVVRDRKVNGRGFVVKALSNAAEAVDVHVLFVPAGEGRGLDIETLESLHQAGVLTVGERGGFAAKGGIITFTMRNNKVHFYIDRESVAKSRLRLSAQLLQLAVPRGGEG